MPDLSKNGVHQSIKLSRYGDHIQLGKKLGYKFITYDQVENHEKFIILRHDIDVDLECALIIAELEHKQFVESTFFIMLHNDLYNPFSKRGSEILKRIQNLGHEIGLHFDPTFWKIESQKDLINKIHLEIRQLSEICDREIFYVSFHQPSPILLGQTYRDDLFESVYNEKFTRGDIRYIADSMGMWREESIDELFKSQISHKIHFLSHPVLWVYENDNHLGDRFESFLKDKMMVTRAQLANAINNKERDIILFEPGVTSS